MTAHKHAEMIKAKADNMDLVVFRSDCDGQPWYETYETPVSESEFVEYFLCLPKHNENGQCLHWLNGGDVEFRRNGDNWQDECEKYQGWADYCGMMNPDVEFRIKPRKEKRWIAVDGDGNVAPKIFLYELDAKFWVNYNTEKCQDYWQFIEIEVEI